MRASSLAAPMHKGGLARGKEDAMDRKDRTVYLVGAAVGFALFLATALLPALMYGGYAGVVLAAAVFRQPVEGHLLARAFVALGMLMGVFGTAAVYGACGAACAAAVQRALRWLRQGRAARAVR
jgi:hypothetical protein